MNSKSKAFTDLDIWIYVEYGGEDQGLAGLQGGGAIPGAILD